MPLQNRVTPFGEIVADPARGDFMGNRGILHDETRRLGTARWKTRAWLICRLAFGNRRRTVMAPRRYTELFFLDEATALAAGHRPCFECRRAAFYRWFACWAQAMGHGGPRPPVAEIDRVLHAERMVPSTRRKRVHFLPFAHLPDASFVVEDENAHLVLGGRLLRWTPSGYDASLPCPRDGLATVLTPPTALAVLRAGYPVAVHRSASAFGVPPSGQPGRRPYRA